MAFGCPFCNEIMYPNEDGTCPKCSKNVRETESKKEDKRNILSEYENTEMFLHRKNTNIKIILFPILLLCFSITVLLYMLTSNFKSGYVEENGHWVYVSYDEGAGRRMQKLNADDNTFTVLKNKEYALDKDAVFYKGRIIKDANPSTFEVINNEGYSKDANNVFVDFDKIIGANPKTFVYMSFPYSKDDKDAYCGTLPMFVKNIREFKVTESGRMRMSELTSSFIKSNQEYSFIDPQKYEGVVYSDGKAETNEQKFVGYKLVK